MPNDKQIIIKRLSDNLHKPSIDISLFNDFALPRVLR